MNEIFKLRDGETQQEYLMRICQLKSEFDLQWQQIADMVNMQFGTGYSNEAVRKRYQRAHQSELLNRQGRFINEIGENNFMNSEFDSDLNTLDEIKLERAKLSDERVQINAMYRRIAREDTLKEIAHEAVTRMINECPLQLKPTKYIEETGENEGLLLISDWHYGLEINNIFNSYNPEIARKRVQQLQDSVIKKCVEKNITNLTVANLGDLIAGNIHLPIRLNSRLDVISQIMQVTELYGELLVNLSGYCNIKAYSVLDNHSRIDPCKKDSIQLESLARITDWYLKERLAGYNIEFFPNTIDVNIATFNINGFNILAVHGDKDKQSKLVDNLTSFTKQHYDMICSAHLHHASMDEKNNTIVVCNGSLMATDDYAFNLRLNSEPSQTLIVISKESVCEEIHRIVLK